MRLATRRWSGLVGLAALVVGCMAQAQMPDPKQISGVPLPAPDVPTGTISVRVVRGDFTNNVTNQTVEFVVDGKTRSARTDEGGRAILDGLSAGAHVKASTVLDGQRVESQDITIGNTGIRVVLVGVDPNAGAREAAAQKLAHGPAVKGLVVLGPESRIIVELANDRLNIYYVVQIVNSARTPVDIGGPLVVQLPHEAGGVTLMDQPPPQASVNGSRLTVLGPFAPGNTTVDVAFELPFDTGTLTLEQRWPVALQQVMVLMPQANGLDVRSPQLATKQAASDQGQPIIVATGPGLAAGQAFSMDILNLPYHPTWPRNLALTLAGLIVTAGIWAAVFPAPRRRMA